LKGAPFIRPRPLNVRGSSVGRNAASFEPKLAPAEQALRAQEHQQNEAQRVNDHSEIRELEFALRFQDDADLPKRRSGLEA